MVYLEGSTQTQRWKWSTRISYLQVVEVGGQWTVENATFSYEPPDTVAGTIGGQQQVDLVLVDMVMVVRLMAVLREQVVEVEVVPP